MSPQLTGEDMTMDQNPAYMDAYRQFTGEDVKMEQNPAYMAVHPMPHTTEHEDEEDAVDETNSGYVINENPFWDEHKQSSKN